MESVSTQTFKPVWKVQRKFKHPTEWNTLEELIEAPSFHSSEEEANNKKEQLEALNDTVKNSVKVNLSTSLLI